MDDNVKILISIKDRHNIPYPLLARDVGISQTSLYRVMAYGFQPSEKHERKIAQYLKRQKAVS